MPSPDARDRLLTAAAELLDAAQGAEVSTRSITERAGVQAPTLYHHFGSKRGLEDAVVAHGSPSRASGCVSWAEAPGLAPDGVEEVPVSPLGDLLAHAARLLVGGAEVDT